MKQNIEILITEIVKNLYNLDESVNLVTPPSKEFGDFSTNIALQIANKVQKERFIIAQEIRGKLLEIEYINKIEVAGPGFLNLYIKSDYFIQNILNIDDNYGKINSDLPKKIMVEFGHPNTHKLPHIGHLFSYIVGQSIENILKNGGNIVIGANFQGDIGPHVAKCIYAWQILGRPVPETLVDKVKLLQQCYQQGSELYENEKDHELIDKINREIYDPNSEIQKDWKITRQWSIDYYKEFEEYLGIHQQFHYFESEIWSLGYNEVLKHVGDIFEKSEGAIIFPGEKSGLHNRVFITKNNTPTYETKDIGLVIKKLEDCDFDLNITPTAREQNGYFDVVIKAITELYPQLKDKLMHIGFGMVSLSTGKMSSRKGNILSATELIEVIVEQIKLLMKDRNDISESDKESTIKIVALGAIKYAFLKSNILKDMRFDISESISFEGHSGPYLQYVYARIRSVLRQEVGFNEINSESISKLLSTPEERDLAIYLSLYPDIVKKAGINIEPHLIAQYLFELAQTFNKFYNSCSINSAENIELINARRILADKTSIVIKLGLGLLGIQTVEKM